MRDILKDKTGGQVMYRASKDFGTFLWIGGDKDGDKRQALPRTGTQGRKLLELIAVSGDFPVSLLERLPGGRSYKEANIKKLKRDNWIRTMYQDSLRTWRLSAKAKRMLVQENPDRFLFYLTGVAETNRLKSEITRRLRLAHIAAMYVMMENAGVLIYRDSKPRVFAPTLRKKEQILFPCFYSSREIKEIGLEAAKIRSSRVAGVLLTETKGFVVYNCGNSLMKWGNREELRLKAFLQVELFGRRLAGRYTMDCLEAILFSDKMETASEMIRNAKKDGAYFVFEGNYRHFYFLTNDSFGETLLRLLCCPEKKHSLEKIFQKNMKEKDLGYGMEHDATDVEGKPVLFGWFCDLPRIMRFYSALSLKEKKGIIICFDFQRNILERNFGSRISIHAIDFCEFQRRF